MSCIYVICMYVCIYIYRHIYALIHIHIHILRHAYMNITQNANPKMYGEICTRFRQTHIARIELHNL